MYQYDGGLLPDGFLPRGIDDEALRHIEIALWHAQQAQALFDEIGVVAPRNITVHYY
ncbi:MAG: hypothetical protein S4CHLAM102_14340 [Chlamydiia bacterium]|nr:hypothetical protein [Chlamydiia bacterium]